MASKTMSSIQFPNSEDIFEIVDAQAREAAMNAVQFHAAQALTSEEQAQACENIGAAATDVVIPIPYGEHEKWYCNGRTWTYYENLEFGTSDAIAILPGYQKVKLEFSQDNAYINRLTFSTSDRIAPNGSGGDDPNVCKYVNGISGVSAIEAEIPKNAKFLFVSKDVGGSGKNGSWDTLKLSVSTQQLLPYLAADAIPQISEDLNALKSELDNTLHLNAEQTLGADVRQIVRNQIGAAAADVEIPIPYGENERWYCSGRTWICNEALDFGTSNAIPILPGYGKVRLEFAQENPSVNRLTFSSTASIAPNGNGGDDPNVVKYVRGISQTTVIETEIPSNAKYLFVGKDVNGTGKNSQWDTLKLTMLAEDMLPHLATDIVPQLVADVASLKAAAGATDSAIGLETPEQYALVVGDCFELFWKGVVHAVHPENYYVKAKCTKGQAFRRKFVFTPTQSDVGVHALSLELYDDAHALIDSKTVKLVVKAKATAPDREKVVLYVGDSLTDGGYVPEEFDRRLTAVGGAPEGDGLTNIAFIGNRSDTGTSTRYVGNSGWQFSSYGSAMKSDAFMWIECADHGKTAADQHSVYLDANSVQWKLETIEDTRIKLIRASSAGVLPDQGTLTWSFGGGNGDPIVYTAASQAAGNPFWNEATDQIDFAAFVQAQGKESLDYVYVLLGWNSARLSESETKTAARTWIDGVLSAFPECQIVLLGLEVPAFDGLAQNYGANTNLYSEYDALLNYVFALNRWYASLAAEYANVSFLNIAGQFDSDYNMQCAEFAVNTRNSKKEIRQINGIHPAQSGYFQIADACYRDLTHRLQE